MPQSCRGFPFPQAARSIFIWFQLLELGVEFWKLFAFPERSRPVQPGLSIPTWPSAEQLRNLDYWRLVRHVTESPDICTFRRLD